MGWTSTASDGRPGRSFARGVSAVAAPVLALAMVSACTSPAETPAPGPITEPTTASPAGEDPFVLGVIGSVTGEGRRADRPFLDGMALAEAEINGAGGVAGRPIRLQVVNDGSRDAAAGEALGEMLRPPGPHPDAVLVAGPGRPIVEHRPEIQALGRPVVLLGSDLYSERLLFRQVFQTGPPLRWQARVVARYLGRDRGHRRVVAVREPARAAFLEELAIEGVEALTIPPGDDRLVTRARGADALIALVGLEGLAPVLDALDDLEDPPQLVLPADLLRTDLDGLPPGTVAPGPYTWAPWAHPIPRVRGFRSSFERTIGHLPVAAEQEGYDAVRILAQGLEETGGRTGEPLVRFLERNRPTGPVFSSTSVTLGPDDHLFAGELWLGMFAVAGRGERAEPWLEGTSWRPIIRTFTYNGERTLFPEHDRRDFFPFWRPGRPSPKFHRARWGIVTGRGDPLH